VVKTHKLYVGGAFVRSESGRHLAVRDRRDRHVANVPRASRKDVRDAVRAARAAAGPWQARTAYNRGQVLYRVAEALESRLDELEAESVRLRGGGRRPRRELEATVDAAVHYAGWTDKLHAVLGSVNPIAGPYLGLSTPEATGVIAVLAPDEPDVLGLMSAVLPVLAAGGVAVALVSERWPVLPLHLGEILGVSDVPAGVVNLLAGLRSELLEPLAGHRDIDGILDATGDPEVGERAGRLGAETIKRVARVAPAAPPGLGQIEPFVEIKTAWHPVGT
jgi:acyl-CoA reductase-like NAD-dependent aldehyde dehydrogenase